MNRTVVFILICLTILAGAEVATVLTSSTPAEASNDVLWTFFVSSWLLLTGIITGVWHFVKQHFIYRIRRVSFAVSLRQAALTSAVIVLSLFFNSLHVLTLWDMLPLAISTLLIEFFFQADTLPASRRNERSL